jgi:hypothetical protein
MSRFSPSYLSTKSVCSVEPCQSRLLINFDQLVRVYTKNNILVILAIVEQLATGADLQVLEMQSRKYLCFLSGHVISVTLRVTVYALSVSDVLNCS